MDLPDPEREKTVRGRNDKIESKVAHQEVGSFVGDNSSLQMQLHNCRVSSYASYEITVIIRVSRPSINENIPPGTFSRSSFLYSNQFATKVCNR